MQTRACRLLSLLSLLSLLALLLVACSGDKRSRPLRLATTTSLQDSGLLTELLPAFEQRCGCRVEVSAVGSGKALELLQSGAADVAVTHAPDPERAALAAGQIARRTPFMHNDFVLVGPKDQASVVAGAGDVREALRRVAASGRKFVSRGDGSGTHQRELALWSAAGIPRDAPFVTATHAGMAETLAAASKEGAFALADRSTFLARRGELDLAIVFQGDDALRNVYSALEPKSAEGEGKDARAFVDFLRSPEGRALIGQLGVKAFGEPLFTPEE